MREIRSNSALSGKILPGKYTIGLQTWHFEQYEISRCSTECNLSMALKSQTIKITPLYSVKLSFDK